MQLRIGYRNYDVIDTPELDLADRGHSAEIHFRDGLILVSPEGPKAHRVEKILHEVMHGFLYDAGINLEDDMEETVVLALTPRFTAFLRDNPIQVRKFIKDLQ